MNSLQILDPHHRWSTEYPPPGGPIYNFLDNDNFEAMRDQMAAFSTIMKEFDRPFQGTIIRIPLRTMDHAMKSDISERETSFSEVAQVMQAFANDFGCTGLLFMSNVQRISIEVGDKLLANICVCNGKEVSR